MTLAGVAKFVLGVSVAIAIALGGSVLVGLYFMYRLTTHPPKPVFPNEKVTTKAKKSPEVATAVSKPTETPKPTQTPKPTETTSPKPLAPGTYKARVNWSEGLSLRAEPKPDAERVGGLGYNQQVVVLEQSADKNWQKIRLADGEQEGWIKAGNVERIPE